MYLSIFFDFSKSNIRKILNTCTNTFCYSCSHIFAQPWVTLNLLIAFYYIPSLKDLLVFFYCILYTNVQWHTTLNDLITCRVAQ